MPEAGTKDPAQLAAEALGRHGIPVGEKKPSAATETPKSTEGEPQAASEADPKKPSRKEWSAGDLQTARHFLDRYNAPNAKSEDLSDDDVEFGLKLASMQDGLDAKAKRHETELETIKAELEETKKALTRKASTDRKSDDFDAAGEMLKKAVEDGDSSQIGPALEKLKAALTPSQSESAPRASESSGDVEEALVEAARTQLEQDWPALRNDGIWGEVLDLADGLKGTARYADMRSAQARNARLRDAATLALGAVASKQTQPRPPGSSAPRPGQPDPVTTKTPKDPLAAARSILTKHGIT